jgi:plastocyanin
MSVIKLRHGGPRRVSCRNVRISRGWTLPVGVVSLMVALAACTSTASPGSSTSSTAPMSMPATAASTVSAAPSPSGPVRCAVTPDATPSATINIFTNNVGIFNFSDPVTIKAGEAVAFVAPNGSAHTITEGVDGKAAANACVNEGIASGTTLIVTFYEPGTYQITCRPHPPMQTSVIVEAP